MNEREAINVLATLVGRLARDQQRSLRRSRRQADDRDLRLSIQESINEVSLLTDVAHNIAVAMLDPIPPDGTVVHMTPEAAAAIRAQKE